MKHLLWALPLLLGITLLGWCFEHPLNGSGREFLAGLLISVSILLMIFIRIDQSGEITGYNEVHTNDR